MKLLWTLLLTICFANGFAQVRDHRIADELKDTFVSKYNHNDLKGIYQLTDTAFSNHITESQLTGFLRGNRNSGNILKDSLLGELNGKFTYLLIAESRDLRLNLEVTAARKISGFGMSNAPLVLLEKPKAVNSSNPMKTPLDLSVDSAAREYYRNPNAQGVAIGFIQNGRRYAYFYGELSPDHLLEIGSITKTFTGTLLAQAVLDKKVALSDDIRKYLTGDYPNLAYNGTPITLQDLANHTSRLPELPDDIGTQPGFNPLAPEKDYDSVLFYAALHRVKLDTLPGYKYNYSNFGISLLGHILERVYGQSYASLLKKYITGPFAMKHTFYELNAQQQNRMAIPHGENGRRIPFQEEGMFGPAGDIHATLGDMLIYLDQQIRETAPAVKLSHQPTAGNVGLAWGVRHTGTYRDIQHNGSTIGFTAHLSAFPELNSGCVILTNSKANLRKLIYAIQQIARRKTL
ncbi:CubicO group peptidase, beta-lactamase class C family [Mucilaginibacter pineti]|uniref:CubicO group peptidase, beta-lactamase class C family n=1 Tax=Mucilaginibacter pineti TaxID=1391627 RepID=A0A1G7EHP2_9SPHI|nr:serine hydrolase domain-containing protein [Mucilaginibacter pineti]SDE63199.1 CubicO group peptidase, beta-lactamase class C family [Mucilaginibacter pineti]